MIQSGGFLGRLLGPLLRTGLPLMKSVIKPLSVKPLSAKSVLVPLGLTAAATVADAGIHKKILGPGHNTTLIISNDKEQKRGFFSMLLGTLGASLLGDLLFSKKVKE